MAHKAMGRRLDPLVQTGTVECARSGEFIEPGTPWQLDHRNEVAAGSARVMPRAKRVLAGRRMVASTNGHRGGLEEQPYKWSQRWSEDPPPGTTVNVGNGFVDIYIGRGIWQTVAAS